MTDYTLSARDLTKLFGRRLVFSGMNFDFVQGGIYGIEGSNGSGKSTLSKIIAGIISPTKGEIKHTFKRNNLEPDDIYKTMGFVSPYLALYDEFSADENLYYFSKMRGIPLNDKLADELFERFNLSGRRNDLLRAYSSGMKQRMKFIYAFIHKPKLILLDEPTSNLDKAGKEAVYNLIGETSGDSLIIIASNEKEDLNLCSSILNIENYKNIGRKG